jgi:hypothetical protein
MENMSDRLKEQEAQAEGLRAEELAARHEFSRMAKEEGWTDHDIQLRAVERLNWGTPESRDKAIAQVNKRFQKQLDKRQARLGVLQINSA